MSDIEAKRAQRVQKRLKAESWSVSEERSFVNLGFDTSGRITLGWDLAASKNLLVAGYGVRPTEWAISAIVGHFKHYGVPVYGQDFSSFVSGFGKGTFKSFTTSRSDSEKMLEQLAGSDEEHVLLVTAAEHLLAPAYLTETERALEPQRYERIVSVLQRELDNPAAHVVLTTSRLNIEEALPTSLLDRFATFVLSSKIFARDQAHILREEQAPKAVEDAIKKMSATHALLLPAGGKVIEFESFRPSTK